MKETREFKSDLGRYYFDGQACRSENGWAQVDTDQDAHYFGTWANARLNTSRQVPAKPRSCRA